MAAVSWMTSIGVEPVKTCEQVARELGISRVRVLQLEKSALRKMRRLLGEQQDLDQKWKVVRRAV